jgi:hypothetical protein
MPNYRKFRVSYTIPGQILQKIDIMASDINAAREIVKSMMGSKVIMGYIEEVR